MSGMRAARPALLLVLGVLSLLLLPGATPAGHAFAAVALPREPGHFSPRALAPGENLPVPGSPVSAALSKVVRPPAQGTSGMVRPPGWPASMAFPPTASSFSSSLSSRPSSTAVSGTWGLVGAPATRFAASMAYDPDLSATVIFGGYTDNGGVEGDTWTYDATTQAWAVLPSPTAPVPRYSAVMAYDPADHLMVLFGGVSAGGYVLGDTWGLSAAGAWENLTPLSITPYNTPAPREWSSLATSFGSGVILYGGLEVEAGAWTVMGDTWSFSLATGWTQLCLQGSCGPVTPGPLFGATLGFDFPGSDDVLFGGDFGPSFTNATWMFNATGWYNLTYLEVPSPGARAFAAIAGNPGPDTLMGGLAPNGGEYSDMWVFTPPVPTTSWSPLTPLPYGGSFLSAAADPSGETLLWGELNFTLGPIPNLWAWKTGTWSIQFGPPGSLPPTPDLTVMADDAADGYVVAFTPGTNDLFPTTWTYRDGTWTNITPSIVSASNSPPSRFGSTMAYDAADGEAILYGGVDLLTGHLASDTWAFQGGAWTNITPSTSPPALFFPSLAPSFPGGPLVLFGGNDLSGNPTAGTWTFLHGTWTQETPATSPPARAAAASTWDRNEHGAIVYGGRGVSTALDDTWRFDLSNDTWTAVCQPSCTGVVIAYPSMTFDPRDNKTLLVGGQTGQAFYLAGGAWSVQNTAPYPMARYLAAMTYDASPSDGYALLYGGIGGSTAYQDTWCFAPALNISVPVLNVSGPAIANRTSVDATQQSVQLSASVSGGGAGAVLESWENLPAGCTGLMGTKISCVPTAAGNYTIFNEANTSGGVPELAGGIVALTVDPALVLGPTLRADRTQVDVEQSFTLWTNASGGTGTYTDLWRGVGAGVCSGSDEVLTCHFPSPGTYSISLNVTDSNGVSLSTSPITVVVGPAPTLAVPVASPDPAVMGSTLTLTQVVEGGTSPLVEVWKGLPPGCPSASTLLLVCTPNAPGNFAINVTVTDANGIVAKSASLALSVLTAPAALSVSAQATPSTGAAPFSTTFQATAQGGAPPVVFAWSFGDGTHGVGASAQHTYAASGRYTAQVWANDSQGDSTGANVSVSVGPAPLHAYLVETPTSTATGGSVDWKVEVSGGLAPYSVVWTGLPSGCPSSGANVSCAPSASGTFSISAAVSDSAGSSVTVATSLVVSSASSTASTLFQGPTLWILLVLGGAIVLGAVLVVLGLRRPRRPRSSTSSQGSAPASPAGETAPGKTDDAPAAGTPDSGTAPKTPPAPSAPSPGPGASPPPLPTENPPAPPPPPLPGP
ncbi:MAG: PKD domain-containing protein [Euryarchaeota archaeon]|nr:PKD domain-containing protein [Euryarchaeota archaeon]MDE1837320.1 PKD domain-containing protein [Euryarchaeota archaeon]MDE1881010.1 PKD domain-containing protein [Euryarchaeota archaeon]MDE2045249.1 PKD domain-containing protein [Thermoplasmata archaeon]